MHTQSHCGRRSTWLCRRSRGCGFCMSVASTGRAVFHRGWSWSCLCRTCRLVGWCPGLSLRRPDFVGLDPWCQIWSSIRRLWWLGSCLQSQNVKFLCPCYTNYCTPNTVQKPHDLGPSNTISYRKTLLYASFPPCSKSSCRKLSWTQQLCYQSPWTHLTRFCKVGFRLGFELLVVSALQVEFT